MRMHVQVQKIEQARVLGETDTKEIQCARNANDANDYKLARPEPLTENVRATSLLIAVAARLNSGLLIHYPHVGYTEAMVRMPREVVPGHVFQSPWP